MLKRYITTGIHLGKSQTARHLYWVFSGNAVSIILAFLATVIIARALSKEDFGIYLALYTFAAMVSDLGEMGVGASLSSFLPPLIVKKKLSQLILILGNAFYIQFLLGVTLTAAIVVTAPILAKALFASSSTLTVILTAAMMLAILLINFSILALSAQKKFLEMATVGIMFGMVRLLLIAVLAHASNLTLLTVLIVFFISPLVGWIYSLIFLPREFFTVKLRSDTVRKLLKFSGFLGLQKLFVALSSRLDLLMLVPLAGAYEAGVYGAGSRIAQVYPFAVTSFAQVLAPKFAEFEFSRDAVKFFKKSALVVVLFLLSVLVMYIFAPFLFQIFFPDYQESIPVFRALLIAMLGFIIATPFVSLLVYTLKKPHIIAIATLLQLLTVFIANSIFIPRFGRFGPIIGIGLGNLVILAITAVSSWYYMGKMR